MKNNDNEKNNMTIVILKGLNYSKQKCFNKCHRTHLSLSVFPDPCFHSPFKRELLSSKMNTCVSKSHPIL